MNYEPMMLLLMACRSWAVADHEDGVVVDFEFSRAPNGRGGIAKFMVAICVAKPWKGGSSSGFRDSEMGVVPALGC